MKSIIYLIALVSTTCLAQIQGNGQITTQNFPLDEVSTISVQLYAKTTIDPTASSGITITGDSNLIPLIGKKVTNGMLTLDQNQWIKSSQDLIIKIGAPAIKTLIHGTHDQTYLINLNQEELSVSANVGEVILVGKVTNFKLESKIADVNAAGLEAQNATVRITGRGSALVNVKGSLDTDLNKNANLKLFTQPAKITGNYDQSKNTTTARPGLEFVSFTLKNNSWNRHNFYVEGPNSDGSSFSYGFPIMPGFTRAERWSVGTKVYLSKALGKRKLLHTVSEVDQDAVIKLFKK